MKRTKRAGTGLVRQASAFMGRRSTHMMDILLYGLESRVLLAADYELLSAGPVEANYARTHGTAAALVIRVDFSDAPGAVVSESTITSEFSQANTRFVDMSYGQFNVAAPVVTPVLRLPNPKSFYNNALSGADDLRADARAAATTAGYSVDSYWTDVYSFADMNQYGWLGLAVVDGKGLWLNGTFTVNTLVHEMGHNLGLRHSDFWDSSTSDPVGPGTQVEYGNPFDTMGDAYSNNDGDFSAYQKNLLQWLDNTQVVEITSSTTQRIYALDQGTAVSGNIYGVTVSAGANTYWLEYRKDFAATQDGVLIDWAPTPTLKYHMNLLDMTPDSQSTAYADATDAALTVGATWNDAVSGWQFKVVGTGTTGQPWIEVQLQKGSIAGVTGNSVSISDGDLTPSVGDFTDFGSVLQSGAPISRSFTITNSGNTPLTIASFAVPTGFTVVTPPSSTVAAGGQTTFVVRLDTAVPGVKSGQISFVTNDSSATTYNFAITGRVNALNTPIGFADSITVNSVVGWAYNPTVGNGPIQIRIKLDSVTKATYATDVLRSDVNSLLGITGNHGFNYTLPANLTPGNHFVAVYGLDQTGLVETLIGYKNLIVPVSGTPPIGFVDGIINNKLVGWAYDNDAKGTALTLKVVVDGNLSFSITTNVSRPDVNSAYGLSGAHGFAFDIPPAFQLGSHTFAVYAADTASNVFQQVGTKSINTLNPTPQGYVDSASATTVSGWAFDGDTPSSPINVVVKVDGLTVGTTSTNVLRTDVNAAYTLSGNHGFSYALPGTLSTGTHVVEVYGVDATTGLLQSIGSRSVTVSRPPVGNFEFANTGVLYGWAYDPDVLGTSINVRVDIDGVTYTTVATSILRSDVNTAFGLTGNHGFMLAMPTLTTGTHSISVYALDTTTGLAYLLPGTKTVIV